MSPHLTRRTLVTTSAGAVFATALTPSGYAAAPRGRKRAYVVVVDGCKPEEISATLTPTLAGLRDGGLNYPGARSLPIMETIPNHVMMMSGLRPDRTGVPANVIYDRELKDTRTLDRPRDLKRRTVLERLDRGGFTPRPCSARSTWSASSARGRPTAGCRPPTCPSPATCPTRRPWTRRCR